MNECDVNLTTVSTFLGAVGSILSAIATLTVISLWRKQKAEEIYSAEAKKLLILIERFSHELSILKTIVMDQNHKESISEEQLIELKNIGRATMDQANFFNQIINQEDELIRNIYLIISKYYAILKDLINQNCNKRIVDSRSRFFDDSFDKEIDATKKRIISFFKYNKS